MLWIAHRLRQTMQQFGANISAPVTHPANVIHPVVRKAKPQGKFFGEQLAYLLWKQYNADKDNKIFRISQETRLMEKETAGK